MGARTSGPCAARAHAAQGDNLLVSEPQTDSNFDFLMQGSRNDSVYQPPARSGAEPAEPPYGEPRDINVSFIGLPGSGQTTLARTLAYGRRPLLVSHSRAIRRYSRCDGVRNCRLHIFDLVSLRGPYEIQAHLAILRNSHVCVVCFPLDKADRHWKQQVYNLVQSARTANPAIQIILAGTKCDLQQDLRGIMSVHRMEEYFVHRDMARRVIFCSGRTGEGVRQLLDSVTSQLPSAQYSDIRVPSHTCCGMCD